MGLPAPAYSFDFSFLGTSAIWHFGHLPGLSSTTSACIGHVYFFADASADALGDGDGLDSAKVIAPQIIKVATASKRVIFLMRLFGG